MEYNVVMKNLLIVLLLTGLSGAVYAASINAAAYRTMQVQAYQNRYRKQQQTKQIPYWQLQSNYTTRGKVYQNYSDYTSRGQK